MARPRAFSKTPSPSAMAGDALAAPPMAPTSFPATASPARPAFGKKPAKKATKKAAKKAPAKKAASKRPGAKVAKKMAAKRPGAKPGSGKPSFRT